MSKILTGKVVSNKMVGTAVVEVTRVVAHPLYKKLLTKSKKYKVATLGIKVEDGQTVKIIETRPISAHKHFALLNGDIKTGSEKKAKPEPVAKAKKAKSVTKKENNK